MIIVTQCLRELNNPHLLSLTFIWLRFNKPHQRAAPLSYLLASLTKQINPGISQIVEIFKGRLRSGVTVVDRSAKVRGRPVLPCRSHKSDHLKAPCAVVRAFSCSVGGKHPDCEVAAPIGLFEKRRICMKLTTLSIWRNQRCRFS